MPGYVQVLVRTGVSAGQLLLQHFSLKVTWIHKCCMPCMRHTPGEIVTLGLRCAVRANLFSMEVYRSALVERPLYDLGHNSRIQKGPGCPPRNPDNFSPVKFILKTRLGPSFWQRTMTISPIPIFRDRRGTSGHGRGKDVHVRTCKCAPPVTCVGNV